MAGSYYLAFASVAACVILSTANELARGWGDNLDWVSLKDGLEIAQEQKKPLMVIIHKSWCGACKALRPKFAEKKEIEELSKQLVMVNTEDDEEPEDEQFSQDGKYIPRIFFLNTEGKVQTDIVNANGSDKYKFYYPNPADIVTSMKKAIDTIGGTSRHGEEL